MNLDGSVAIVTGGAMGNGLGIVKAYLKAGARVYIIDYDLEALEKTVKKLKKDYPLISGYAADIRDKKMLEDIFKDISKEQKKIDILVNNAGVARLSSFEEMSDELRDFHFDINIKGTWNVTKVFLPLLKKSKHGRIINLSSVTGLMVCDCKEVAYATTKAALLGFTKSLAMELASSNIMVNAILPGYIMTPMVEGIAKESLESDPNKVILGIAENIPLKRLGTIDELGNLALFLASKENSYITGSAIVIDGGSTLPETMSVGV